MIALPALLLVAGAHETAPPAITIDPCVEVDAEEVRRLTAIELTGERPRTLRGEFDVAVTCEGGGEALRLTDRARRRVWVRSIDLSASEAGDRDAKTRELALAIAELFRRADVEATPADPPSVTRAFPPAPTPPPDTQPEPQPSRLELGVTGVRVGWTGGEELFGADVTGRVHLVPWLIAEVRLGGRRTRSVDLETGSIDGHGMVAAAGLSADATPSLRRAGVSFGARIAGDWLRYALSDSVGATSVGKDALALSVAGTATAFVVVSEPLCLTVDAAAGGALHSVLIRENDRPLSGLRGVLLSSAIGLAAQF